MKKYTYKLKIMPKILLVVLIPLIIIALPFLLIAALYDGYIVQPRRSKQLIPEIKKTWIPNHKYIYLEYSTYVPPYRADKNSNLIEFIEGNIIPKYKKYLVIKKFSGKNYEKTEFNKAAFIISQDYISDYDAYLEASIVTIDPNLNFQTYSHKFSYNYDSTEVEKTKKLFIEKIEECLKDWK